MPLWQSQSLSTDVERFGKDCSDFLGKIITSASRDVANNIVLVDSVWFHLRDHRPQLGRISQSINPGQVGKVLTPKLQRSDPEEEGLVEEGPLSSSSILERPRNGGRHVGPW
jgi:hypothetical protein